MATPRSTMSRSVMMPATSPTRSIRMTLPNPPEANVPAPGPGRSLGQAVPTRLAMSGARTAAASAEGRSALAAISAVTHVEG